MIEKSFMFICCQHGAEWTIKQEILQTLPHFKSAFQRPGLITFRSDGPPVTEKIKRPSRFAFLFGKSLGSAKTTDDLYKFAVAHGGPLRLHVVDRASFGPVDTELSALAGNTETALRELDQAGRRLFLADVLARVGDTVLDVVVADGEPTFVGVHRHERGIGSLPGGKFGVVLPKEAPSPAYLKVEEAIRAFDLPVLAGDVAVDIGASPGGATYALLQRGLSVVAVDPGAMDPFLLRFQGPAGARLLAHLPMTVGSLRWENLPEQTDWLLCDVNLAPQVALHAMKRILAGLRHTLIGVIFTLKLSQWSFAEQAEAWERGAEQEGLYFAAVRQLPSHRQECCLVGLTAIGKKRLAKSLNR